MKFKTCTVAIFSLMLNACSSDVEVPRAQVPEAPNVQLVSLSSPDQLEHKPGQPLTLDFSVSSTNISAEHVGVTFIAIEKSKVTQLTTDEDPDGYYLGEHYIESLTPGTHAYEVMLKVPDAEMPLGDYVIAGYVDSSNIISNETTKDDNRSRDYETDSSTTYGAMSIVEGEYHDFEIHDLKVGDGFALFPAHGQGDTDIETAPDDHHSDLIGFIDAWKHGDNVKHAEISARITVADETFIAHLWHPDTKNYSDKMTITFPDHEQEHYFPWDIAVNGPLLTALQQHYDESAPENTFALTFEIHDLSDEEEHHDHNNEMTIHVPYALFENEVTENEKAVEPQDIQISGKNKDLVVTPISIQAYKYWAHTYGDTSKVAIVPSFMSSVYVGAANGGALSAEAGGGLRLYMFDNSINLLSAGASGLATVASANAEWEAEFSILGLPIWSEGGSAAVLDEEFPVEWSEELTLFSATFTIAIVPVTVEAGISGSIGAGFSLGFEDFRFNLGGDLLSASLDAYATASINLLVASGGIGVDFLIISDTFSATAYADISEAISKKEVTLGIEVTNELKAVEGEFYVFVRYPGYKFCCSFPTKEKRWTIYNTGALYDKTWTLLDESKTLSF